MTLIVDGFNVDAQLKFEANNWQMKQRCSKFMDVFIKPEFFLERVVGREYPSYIQDIYQYGASVYSTANKTALTSVEKQ